MGMFLYLEGLVLLLEHNANVNVESRSVLSKRSVIGVLDIPAGKFGIVSRNIGGGIIYF